MPKRWSKREENLLKDICCFSKKDIMPYFPERTWSGVKTKIQDMGLKRYRVKQWSNKELIVLSDLYPCSTKDEICSIIKRPWVNIRNKAAQLGISRSKNVYRRSNLEVLLRDCHETYYWMGFLMADGYFKDGRIMISLSSKDTQALYSLSNYLECRNNVRTHRDGTVVTLTAKNINIVPMICEKFDIHNKKTYNPPCHIPYLFQKDFIIGLIDGDGNITKKVKGNSFKISIKMHSSWLHILKEIEGVLYANQNVFRSKINKLGYAELCISDSKTCLDLKRHATNNALPILHRKWDKIDLKYVNPNIIAVERKKSVLSLRKRGLNPEQISNETNLKYNTVYKIIERNVNLL